MEWFWAGLLGGLGYALSGVVMVVGIFILLLTYVLIRVILDVSGIWKWGGR